MLGGTACFYALYILKGWETMHLVGLVTTSIEVAGALVLLSSTASIVPSRQRAVAVAAVPVALLSLLGTNIIASSTSASANTTPPSASAPATAAASGNLLWRRHAGNDRGELLVRQGHRPDAAHSPAGNIVWPDHMSAMAAGMKMAEPNCTTQPTAAHQQSAVDLVNQTVAAAQRYTSLATAKAAGYVPVTRSGARIVHCVDPAIYRGETSASTRAPSRRSST